MRYCIGTKYHSSYFAGWQAAVQGPTSLMVREFATQAIRRTSHNFPSEHTEESCCLQGTTGPMETSPGGAGWMPKGRQQVPSRECCGNRAALSSLCCLPFLQSSQQSPACVFLQVVIPFSPCSFSCQGKSHSVLKLFGVMEVEGSRTASQHESL